MNWQTKKKIDEIKQLMKEGYSRKDILQKKFNRSTSNLIKHLESGKEFYTAQELEFLNNTEENHVSLKPLPYEVQFLSNKENALAFEKIIAHADEIIAMVQERKEGKGSNTKITEHLDIPNTFTGLDIKTKSFRIAKEIDDDFADFCNKYKHYSKTAIFNFALSEFMKKYK